MKEFSKEMVDDVIRLRYCQLVTSANHRTFVTCKKLGRVFGVSSSKIYQLIRQRFESDR